MLRVDSTIATLLRRASANGMAFEEVNEPDRVVDLLQQRHGGFDTLVIGSLLDDPLRASNERLQSIIPYAFAGIVTIDERGAIVSFNPAAERIFGYREAEVVGQNVRRLMPEPFHSEHDRHIERYLKTGESHIIGIAREIVGRRKDGSTFPADLAISEFRQGDRTAGCGGRARRRAHVKRSRRDFRRPRSRNRRSQAGNDGA